MDSLHNIEKDLNAAFNFVLKSAKVRDAEELNETVMTKMHKGPLINCVEKPFGRLKSNIELCRSAAGKIDRLQADCIKSKTELKALQQNKLNNVQNSVRKEMQSWSDIVQKNCEKSSVPSVKSVKQVVKSYVDENDRSRSFIIYGAKEEKGEHTLELVEDLLLAMNEEKKHQVLGSLRLGTIKKDSDSVRPIKVTLGSADSVKEILSKAKTLKTLYGSYAMFSKMYLAPDCRSREERIEHKTLVEEMELLISKEPNKHHYIRNGKIVSVLRGLSYHIVLITDYLTGHIEVLKCVCVCVCVFAYLCFSCSFELTRGIKLLKCLL